jgi:alkylated DNA nucleotide flippase Atl1
MVKKTYLEKLNNVNDLPKIIELNEKAQKKFGGETMAVPKPTDVYEIMKNIPKGKLITISEIRKKISKKYKTDTSCPFTIGIFTNISANASLELNDNMPYWRTLKSKGELNPKFPNALEVQLKLLENEGFKIIKKGIKNIKYFVKDYDKYLVLEI